MSDNEDVSGTVGGDGGVGAASAVREDASGTVGGEDGVGAASSVREARASAEREARAARRGAGGAASSVDSGSDHEYDDVKLISTAA